jgi:hypothetical protein
MNALAVLALTIAAPDPQRGSLESAAAAFDNAQLHHDRALIERFLADDFQYVTRKGDLLGRREFVAATANPDEVLAPFIVRDHRVERLGSDGGVASGDATVRGTHAGVGFADRFRYADVFARRGGRWVVVYTQVTALPHS